MKRIKNKNCYLYYQALKNIFPEVQYKEAKFLRDLKIQIIEYGLLHPNCTYAEVEEFFGSVQSVISDYVELQGVMTVYESVSKKKLKKNIIIGIIICTTFLSIAYIIFLEASYRKYSDSMPVIKETIIHEGDIQ